MLARPKRGILSAQWLQGEIDKYRKVRGRHGGPEQCVTDFVLLWRGDLPAEKSLLAFAPHAEPSYPEARVFVAAKVVGPAVVELLIQVEKPYQDAGAPWTMSLVRTDPTGSLPAWLPGIWAVKMDVTDVWVYQTVGPRILLRRSRSWL